MEGTGHPKSQRYVEKAKRVVHMQPQGGELNKNVKHVELQTQKVTSTKGEVKIVQDTHTNTHTHIGTHLAMAECTYEMA